MAGDVYAAPSGPLNILIDGANLGAPPQPASPSSGLEVVTGATTSPTTISVMNSYFHDSTYGVRVVGYDAAGATVSLVNNTFVNNDDGVYVDGSASLTYSNNLLLGHHDVAVGIVQPLQVSHENNLLFGNANNYSGTAVDGPGDLKVDPQLDTGVPPEPKTGSPARRSALLSRAPSHDFYGVPRTGGADRGAVQSP